MERIINTTLLRQVQAKVMDVCAITAFSAYLIFMSNSLPLQIADRTDVEIANVVGERHDFTNLEIITVITIDLLINGILIDGYCSYTDGDVITLSVSLDTHILT